MNPTKLAIAVFASLLLLPMGASAQQASGIAGVVRDSSNAVLPGVTVEAASPALIEKTRAVVTDGEGRYSIVDLVPGTYTVTFTLTGFNSFVRQGVELTAGFTANINASLTVGTVEETVTVSGASPVVDVRNSKEQTTISDSTLAALPAGNVGLQTLAYVTPGFAPTQADVGGTRDTWSAQGNYTFYHGKQGTRANFDGFRNQYFVAAASGVGYITDQGNIQELQLETSGMTAEAGSGTVTLNAIPKSGSNIFAGGLDGFYSGSSMQASNLRSNLNAWNLGNAPAAQLITSAAEVQEIYRLGAQVGGPIKQDKLWFFAAFGRWGSTVNEPSAYYNPLQGTANIPSGATAIAQGDLLASPVMGPTSTLFYPGQPGTPYSNATYQTAAASLGKTLTPAAAFDWYRTHAGRVTYNINSKNRVGFYADLQKDCRCTTGPFTGANAIEQERGWDWYPSGVVQGTWTAPLTNRLLLDAGASWQTANWVNFPEAGVGQYDRSIIDTATGYRYGATTLLTAPNARTGRSAVRFSTSYVTGTHSLKFGVTNDTGFSDQGGSRQNVVDGLNYDFSNGKPAALEYYALPFLVSVRQNLELGIYGQDAWTIKRVTLNLGIRYDRVEMGFPAQTLAAGLFVPQRVAPAASGIPTWNDVNPRLGASYDVFGNGKTAVKVSAGRYNGLSRADFVGRYQPFVSSINSANRTWTDSNGNFIVDCNVQNFAAQDLSAIGGDKCGPISNQNFGKYNPAATVFDDSVTYHNRDFLWDFNTLVQQELTRRLSLEVGYNHNKDGSFTVTDYVDANGNSLPPSDYDQFCITVPTDARLATSGQRQCGYYDINPTYFGKSTLRVTNAKEFVGQNGNTGLPQRYWDGFWFTLNGRLPHGATVGGGLDIGRQVDNHCFTVNVPNQPYDINGTAGLTSWNGYNSQGAGTCNVVTSWAHNADFRLRGSVPFKGGFTASAIFRNTAGAVENAVVTITAQNVSSLNVQFTDGRACTPASCLTANTAVNLITPNSVYGPRFNQLDLSVNKVLNLNWSRLKLAFDLYNALNSNSIQNVTTTYGVTWLRPSTFLDPRLARVTAALSF